MFSQAAVAELRRRLRALRKRWARRQKAIASACLWVAGGLGRAGLAVLRDSDSYVLAGIVCLAVGVGVVAGPGAGAIAAGATLLAFGFWLGYWRLSTIRPRGEPQDREE